jgi:hypothetical protein
MQCFHSTMATRPAFKRLSARTRCKLCFECGVWLLLLLPVCGSAQNGDGRPDVVAGTSDQQVCVFASPCCLPHQRLLPLSPALFHPFTPLLRHNPLTHTLMHFFPHRAVPSARPRKLCFHPSTPLLVRSCLACCCVLVVGRRCGSLHPPPLACCLLCVLLLVGGVV